MTENRFVTNKYKIYDNYSNDDEWLVNTVDAEEIVEVMNNLDTKARERSKALSKLQKENNELKKENWILTHFFEQVYYDYLVSVYDADDNELMEMSNAFQSKDLRKILRFCIGKTDKAKLKYYSKLYKVNLK